ncbi:Quinoprotein amine dehydrogenase beta chain-like [Trinorchestia longiramus]|nr:Quinoprotein amine dehydrogenase beta chain-like [Trinorchestia longiramus]
MLQVRSTQGSVLQTLAFPDSEGHPVGVDVCGNYLLSYTILGHVKIWDVSGREVKAHSSSKNFGDLVKDFGEVMSARVNSTGNKASVSVAQTSLLPDPKLYIWDLRGDTVTYFNFASGVWDCVGLCGTLWDLRGDTVTYFNFASGQPEEADLDGSAPPNSADTLHSNDDSALHDRAKREAAREVCGRFARAHTWDREDARLLLCEAVASAPLHSPSASFAALHPSVARPSVSKPSVVLASLFVSEEHGTIVQDVLPLPPLYTRLLGGQVPHQYLLNNRDNNPDGGLVTQRIMRDFTGLEDSDRATREAMLNFSFFLAIGSMDDAFQSIKSIKSSSVWENMGKMCVKTRRLDVAALCLGNMRHARGARALRLAAAEPQLDARVAMLALQLGMVVVNTSLWKRGNWVDFLFISNWLPPHGTFTLCSNIFSPQSPHIPPLPPHIPPLPPHIPPPSTHSPFPPHIPPPSTHSPSLHTFPLLDEHDPLQDEAERLYRGCGRHDLLNKVLQDAGMWTKALNVAAAHDRIHLRTTHYCYAKHLESKGEWQGIFTFTWAVALHCPSSLGTLVSECIYCTSMSFICFFRSSFPSSFSLLSLFIPFSLPLPSIVLPSSFPLLPSFFSLPSLFLLSSFPLPSLFLSSPLPRPFLFISSSCLFLSLFLPSSFLLPSLFLTSYSPAEHTPPLPQGSSVARALRRWWAQYLESTGEMETALQYYEAAGDHLSLVRVYCYCNNLPKAADIANRSGDRSRKRSISSLARTLMATQSESAVRTATTVGDDHHLLRGTRRVVVVGHDHHLLRGTRPVVMVGHDHHLLRGTRHVVVVVGHDHHLLRGTKPVVVGHDHHLLRGTRPVVVVGHDHHLLRGIRLVVMVGHHHHLSRDQLMNLALVAGPQEQVEAARYFATCDRPQVARAVTLYHRAGLVAKALDLAFKSGQVSVVAQIAEDLDDSADPVLVGQCAEYFLTNRQYDKAVNLLITGKQYEKALELCVEHGVWVTEALAERFTLPKEEGARNNILEKVAQCAYLQENYKLATKKYTQAGNKVQVMRVCVCGRAGHAQQSMENTQLYKVTLMCRSGITRVHDGTDFPSTSMLPDLHFLVLPPPPPSFFTFLRFSFPFYPLLSTPSHLSSPPPTSSPL